MIVRYPAFPAVEGSLRLPRPAVFLLGSYDPLSGDRGQWYGRASRILDRWGATVFSAVNVHGFDSEFATWVFFWLRQVDHVVIWVEHTDAWSEFESGWAIGRGGSVHVGSPSADMRTALAIVADCPPVTRIHESLDGLLHGVRASFRQRRKGGVQ